VHGGQGGVRAVHRSALDLDTRSARAILSQSLLKDHEVMSTREAIGRSTLTQQAYSHTERCRDCRPDDGEDGYGNDGFDQRESRLVVSPQARRHTLALHHDVLFQTVRVSERRAFETWIVISCTPQSALLPPHVMSAAVGTPFRRPFPAGELPSFATETFTVVTVQFRPLGALGRWGL
jgi:hypothetical protein